jgi:HCOMODA/2-hydroxy-3-carboxy-muconic semialdehyde decarboxylase
MQSIRGRKFYLSASSGEIYKVRPGGKSVVHHHSPAVIPFGVTNVPLKPIYHMAVVGPGAGSRSAKRWNDRYALVRPELVARWLARWPTSPRH